MPVASPVAFLLRSLRPVLAAGVVAGLLVASAAAAAVQRQTSQPFQGAKANTGSVTFIKDGGRRMLELSADFVVPDTPDPHWRVVASNGDVYLLDRLPLKGDRVSTKIELPAYVKDVAKVEIWCAWAEAVLGEASFVTVQK